MNTAANSVGTVPLAPSTSVAATTSWVSRIVMFGATSIVVGIFWDISWHRTIGRDTFWTPAHMAIYLGGLLGGLTAGWLVIKTSFFGSAEERAGAVRLWGLRAPLGAWVSIWGSLAMLTSAPFDNWWHDAYGLDVKILSPPHTVLALGMWAVVLGALMLVLREQNNRAHERAESEGAVTNAVPGRWLFVYGSGVLVAMASVFLIEMSFPNQQRSAAFYVSSAATFPVYLLGMARAAKFRWGSTLIALVYMLIVALMAWVLPLFPGEPRLGPIANRIDHFVSLPFPLLLVVPALAMDLFRNWIGHGRGWWRDWLIVFGCATIFLGLFLATQWHFSEFLLSANADNWFFAADRHWGYGERPGEWRKQFWSEIRPESHPGVTWLALGKAFLASFLASRLGLSLGNWMVKVRR